MNLLNLIATLAAAWLQEPIAPIRPAGPVVAALASATDPVRAELEAAIRWFADAVAGPLLAARTVEELLDRLALHRDTAVQARLAIANAVSAVLVAAPPARDDLEVDPGLIAHLNAHGTSEAAVMSDLLVIATADFADFHFFLQDRGPPDPDQMQAALATLLPLATEAEIWLLVALIGLHAKDAPDPAVLATVVGAAQSSLLRHRAALHATLRRWDRVWVPTIEAPAWADDPTGLDLDDAAIDTVVALIQAPPPPTDALRRALARR